MEREKFQEFSASSASHSSKFEQDSEGSTFVQKSVLVRQKQKNVPLGIVLPCKRSRSDLRSIFSISLMLLRSVGRVKGPLQPLKSALPSLMSLITMPGKVP